MHLRSVFQRIDKDGDGYISAADLNKQYLQMWTRESDADLSRPKCCRSCQRGGLICTGDIACDVRKLIFEVDDDGDGMIGWEEFSNLWVRLKKPFGPEDGGQPMALFNLIDFFALI